ncbi:glycyl-radical enzyme activating protein [Eubacterium sp. AF22-8LB]|uniref:glycyl-radical enzyme activating protein n=1 Tax=Eubacterium sp. AF22-8LB TaxID=2292232 RepID=UPI000E54B65C|nr:glycyl-radical enzyme activating protein [Eubacterium sp. AF22-8LB]RGS31213.1 glycyl-radical enzyme activating protein [Eubacterium sp. AF22-8LB]
MIRISNIEKFATHDGPGIRTTVFLKGCFLHCPWCANPETWKSEPVLMHDAKKCVECKTCMHVCEHGAISFPFQWDMDKCIYCKKCENYCLQDAISFAGKDMEINEVIKEVLKDKDYFDQSNGGITISGGEPFMQLDAFLELIKQCKNNGLHVAVETTGNYCLDTLKEALPYIDLFLMDLKHLDAQKLKDITGGNLNLILNNFKYLAQHCPNKVIVRMPVIPRFNDDICEDVIRFCANLKLSEVNLLPFHTMGKSKWNQLNKEFMYDKDKMMDRNDLTPYIDVGKQLGVYVKIGG